MEQLNPVPAFGAKTNTSNISQKIVTEISVQKVSSPECWSGPGNRTPDLPLCSQALHRLS